jgi:hypothetical protein
MSTDVTHPTAILVHFLREVLMIRDRVRGLHLGIWTLPKFFLRRWELYGVKCRAGTLRKNVALVQKSSNTSVEQSFFAGCPWSV